MENDRDINWGAVIWGAALLALAWSCFSIVIGFAVIVLVVSGTISTPFVLVGLLMFGKGVSLFYYLYRWFTKGVEE